MSRLAPRNERKKCSERLGEEEREEMAIERERGSERIRLIKL